MTPRRCQSPAFLLLVLICFNIPKEASFQIITYGIAEDTTIESKSYPGPYPVGENVTWSWEVSSGYWGVVFLDFDLDPGIDSYGDGDQLEINDGFRTATYHTARNPPVVPYKSEKSKLRIRFITDMKTGDKHFKGFQLRILYGQTEPELNRKISLAEVAKGKKHVTQDDDEEKSTPVHVTTAVTLIVVFAAVIIIVVLYSRRKTFRRRLRRQSSTTLRTGRAEMLAATARLPTSPTTPRTPTAPMPRSPVSLTTSAAPPMTGSGARRPSQPFQRSSSQPQRSNSLPFQRSVSQVDWSAQAELSCFALEGHERLAEPNDYARSEPTHQTNIKCTISHGGGASGISVSSSITTSAAPHSNLAPPRRLQKSQSEKVMTTVGAAARNQVSSRNETCSLSKLSTIYDSQEFSGTGDFVDTIDHLDPIPLEAIRGKNLLPPYLRSSEELDGTQQASNTNPHHDLHFDLNSTSPPPYVTQTSSESGSCYENVFLNRKQMSTERKSSIYTNQISIESAELPEFIFVSKGLEQANPQPAGTAQSKQCSPSIAELAGDYAYLKEPDASVLDNGVPKENVDDSIAKEDVFDDVLDKVVPITSTSNAAGRIRRLGSAYDIPPKGDDPYDIPPTSRKPPRGDDPYDIPPRSRNSPTDKEDPYGISPICDRKTRGDDPYDIPPRSRNSPTDKEDPYGISPICDRKTRGDDPYDIPPASGTPLKVVDLFSSPPVADKKSRNDDPYDIPPPHKTRYNDPYDIPPAAGGLYHVPPRANLDYVPTAMARSPANGDYPYDIPPSSSRMWNS
ncbi:hypothetical protein RRG08_006718 [Elysia crispata]|uniref:CUB domain-containing protein n=1 Tax=Elysia crispata TaxID=231223 RepID=A0AAE1EE96_9GAST|nr:hypothetical protein RRG08_006718 [Elysia crispata]